MIAVCPNPYRDIGLEITDKVVGLLNRSGYETCVCQIFTENKPQIKDVASDISMAVIIGGDGTILSAVGDLYGYDVPILGINLGTMGFMTALEPEDIDLVVNAANNEFDIEYRMMLDVALIRDGKTVYSGSCLNDAVIHGYGDTISISAMTNECHIIKFDGDGLIISTPTGSTGYSMSAGGPIVEPSARAIIISPICAHTLRARTYVLSPDRIITVDTGRLHDRKAYLSVDGNSVANLSNGDLLQVGVSNHNVAFIDPGKKTFYEIAYEKLM